MAAVAVVAASVRAVSHHPENTLDFNTASGYTPEVGDIVAISGNDEVDGADATDANSLTNAIGIVVALRQKRDGTYRVTILLRGLVEGFTGLTAGDIIYTSTTAEKMDDADPTTTGVTGKAVGTAKNATQIIFDFPATI